MAGIPVYLKTDPDMPRPEDPEYYLIAQNGTFLCRNHPFFKSDVPTNRRPRGLLPHDTTCILRYPLLSEAAVEYAVGFFHRVYEKHGSEAILLLLWDTRAERYLLYAPEQEATVWESSGKVRTALDVTYQAPLDLPAHRLVVGDIHSHADAGAYASHTDKHDETYRDGVHLVVGRVHRDPPDFHQELVVDGQRFSLQQKHIMRGYRSRRRIIPQQWLDRVKVKVQKPLLSTFTTGYTSYGGYGSPQGYQPSGSWSYGKPTYRKRDDDEDDDSTPPSRGNRDRDDRRNDHA